jgi:SAM-dependent methyltransferase
MNEPDLIAEIYRGILGREPDPAGAALWTERLRKGSVATVLKGMMGSDEFRRNYVYRQLQMEDGRLLGTFSNLMSSAIWNAPIHTLRCHLVQEFLPKARRVLDLGGASAEPEGALLNMGYRGAQEIVIVDLPPDVRFKKAVETNKSTTYDGTAVNYAYHSMAELSHYPDASFDLVWSGQTMEHIQREEGGAVMREVGRILKPGGVFALDTPNRTATGMWTIRPFIHAEHKYEYRYEEFVDAMASSGLELVMSKGLVDLSRSLESGYLIPDEFHRGEINDHPERSFIFFLQYRNPTKATKDA